MSTFSNLAQSLVEIQKIQARSWETQKWLSESIAAETKQLQQNLHPQESEAKTNPQDAQQERQERQQPLSPWTGEEFYEQYKKDPEGAMKELLGLLDPSISQ